MVAILSGGDELARQHADVRILVNAFVLFTWDMNSLIPGKS